MFNKPPVDPELETVIKNLLNDLDRRDPDSKEYADCVNQLVKLYSLKPKQERVSKDTLATILANLFGIFIIVGHERAHTMTSRALNFLQKLR